MRTFVVRLLIFISPLAAFLMVMELALRQLPNDYKFKKDRLDSHADKIQTLILGSSHAFYGLDPRYLSGVTFNAAYVSQSLKYDHEIIRMYQDELIHLKSLILTISYPSLFMTLENSHASWRIKNYVMYYGIQNSSSMSNHFEVLANNFDANVFRLVSFYIKQRSPLSCTASGWGTTFHSSKAKDLTVTGRIAAAKYTRTDIDTDDARRCFDENISVLKSILEWCKQRNVRVLLLTTPAFATYRKHLNIGQLNATVEAITDLVAGYKNCSYINFLDNAEYTASDFYDADHLSEIGAEKLSKAVNNLIVNPPGISVSKSE